MKALILLAAIMGVGDSPSLQYDTPPLAVVSSTADVDHAVLDESSPTVSLHELEIERGPTLVKQRDDAGAFREVEAPRGSFRALLGLLALALGGAPLFGAALAAGRQTPIVGPYKSKSHPVKTATTIYKGGWVAIDSSGYAIPAADAAGLFVVGIAMETIANPGASGAKEIEVACDCWARVSAASIAVTNNGALMYIVDDQTVDEATGTNSIKAGVLEKFISATEGIVYVPPTAAGRVI